MWIATLNKYLLTGVAAAVLLVASGISAQLFATSDAPQGSSLEDADPTLYAHGDRLRPLVEETGGARTLNIYGPGGQIIAQVARDGLGGSQKAPHLLADHLGSTRAALDADGNVVARFEYGPHGETATSGTGTAAELPYRYTGHPYDEAQGLYETPARTYDPTTGRFLSVDPQRQDASPYVYAGNNPVGFVDPTGGGGVPFFIYSGSKESSFPYGDIAKKLGASPGQMIPSDEMFRTIVVTKSNNLQSPAVLDPHGILNSTIQEGFSYNEKLFWIIGDSIPMVMPDQLKSGLRELRTVNPEIARKIAILDFSGTSKGEMLQSTLRETGESSVLIKAYAQVRKIGEHMKADAFYTERGVYLPAEFKQHVEERMQIEERMQNEFMQLLAGTVPNQLTTYSESRPLPRNRLTPLGDPPHTIPLPQHELTPLGDPPHIIPIQPPPEVVMPEVVIPMDTSVEVD